MKRYKKSSHESIKSEIVEENNNSAKRIKGQHQNKKRVQEYCTKLYHSTQ